MLMERAGDARTLSHPSSAITVTLWQVHLSSFMKSSTSLLNINVWKTLNIVWDSLVKYDKQTFALKSKSSTQIIHFTEQVNLNTRNLKRRLAVQRLFSASTYGDLKNQFGIEVNQNWINTPSSSCRSHIVRDGLRAKVCLRWDVCSKY